MKLKIKMFSMLKDIRVIGFTLLLLMLIVGWFVQINHLGKTRYYNQKYHFSIWLPRGYEVNSGYEGDGYFGKNISFQGTFNFVKANEVISLPPYQQYVVVNNIKALKSYGLVGVMGGNVPQQKLSYYFTREDERVIFTLYARDRDDYMTNPLGHEWRLSYIDQKNFEEILDTLEFEN